ncbi:MULTISPECIES: PP0621 family protein [unclassified Caballeronia]|uniref:PP0621 family protein n=1 Tax=unclassified Caballeronia TaxID=2646786 RepID=UPI00286737A0|nr:MULTISPECIES: PP0621 family protein [unclassified Caballeronia]MDR5814502.1 PP0621 family protein [Caballeronia sp. LZ033]MDR5820981.1 PP0621 family protein [Caballeronia sp. LZ043]MDR5879136.1 PP0621 family protein [Caballeronia sp. LZ032]
MRNFLFLIVLFFLSQWLLKKLRRANERAQQGDTAAGGASAGGFSGAGAGRARNGNGSGASAAQPPQLADPLIQCAQCGVHTPRSEAIVVAGERFCCTDHARAHANRPTGRDAR